MLDLYLSTIPPSGRVQDSFYLRLKPVYKIDNCPWYSTQKKSHFTTYDKICKVAGVQRKYTNHSLHAMLCYATYATGATRLFQSGTTKNAIMARSSHRKTDGVQQYERVSQDQHIAAQAILTATDGFKAYDAELQ